MQLIDFMPWIHVAANLVMILVLAIYGIRERRALNRLRHEVRGHHHCNEYCNCP